MAVITNPGEHLFRHKHNKLKNRQWSAAGHTIDTDIVATASGSYDIGTQAIAFSEGNFQTVRADTIRGTDIYAGNDEGLHIGINTIGQDASGAMVFTDEISGSQHLYDLIGGAGGGGVTNHNFLTNLDWANAGHTINADIVPTASGNQDVGTQAIAFSEVNAGTIRGDSGYFTDLYTSAGTIHIGEGATLKAIPAGMQFNTNIVPDASGTITIGDETNRIGVVYIDNIQGNSISVNNLNNAIDLQDRKLLTSDGQTKYNWETGGDILGKVTEDGEGFYIASEDRDTRGTVSVDMQIYATDPDMVTKGSQDVILSGYDNKTSVAGFRQLILAGYGNVLNCREGTLIQCSNSTLTEDNVFAMNMTSATIGDSGLLINQQSFTHWDQTDWACTSMSCRAVYFDSVTNCIAFNSSAPKIESSYSCGIIGGNTNTTSGYDSSNKNRYNYMINCYNVTLGENNHYSTIIGGYYIEVPDADYITFGSRYGGQDSFGVASLGGISHEVDSIDYDYQGINIIFFGGISNKTKSKLNACMSGAGNYAQNYGQIVIGNYAFDWSNWSAEIGLEPSAEQKGDAQRSFVSWGAITADAAKTEADLGRRTWNGEELDLADRARFYVEANRVIFFTIKAVASVNDDMNMACAWEKQGIILNDGEQLLFANSETFDDMAANIVDESSGAWQLSIEADDTNKNLVVKCKGEAEKDIRWHITGDLVELVNRVSAGSSGSS